MSNDIPVLKLAVIGYGDAATDFLCAAAYLPDWAPAAVAGRNRKKAAAKAAGFGVEALSVAEMLKRPDIDAVAVATPPGVHADDAVNVARAGKHLIVEKPMALSLADCDRIISAAAETGVKLMVSQSHRFYPGEVKARELIDAGSIGTVTGVDMKMIWTYFGAKRTGWQVDPAMSGGGVVMNPVIHMTDCVRYFSGKEIASVRARVGYHQPGLPEIEGNATALYLLEDGVTGTVTFYGYGHHRHQQVMIMGTDGIISIPEILGNTCILHKDKTAVEYTGSAVKKHPRDPVNEAYAGHLINLAQAIRTDGPVKSDGRNGRANVAACLALLESARTDKEIML